MTTLPARIFLNEHHGPKFFAEEADAFGAIKSFSNEVLSGSEQKVFTLSEGSSMVLFPVTGDLLYELTLGNETEELNIGEVKILTSLQETEVVVSNPFTDEAINFLVVILANAMDFIGSNVKYNVELPEKCGSFNELFSIPSCRLSIGQFQGRDEAVHVLNGKGCFYYVLAGAFEIQERLLHAGDGLALWDLEQVDMEALSNNAVLLVLDLPYI